MYDFIYENAQFIQISFIRLSICLMSELKVSVAHHCFANTSVEKLIKQ